MSPRREEWQNLLVYAPDQHRPKVDQQLDLVNWCISGGDGLRTGLTSRAGTLLSTDARIVAGVALRSASRARAGCSVLATLACVGASVVNASLVLMTVSDNGTSGQDSGRAIVPAHSSCTVLP